MDLRGSTETPFLTSLNPLLPPPHARVSVSKEPPSRSWNRPAQRGQRCSVGPSHFPRYSANARYKARAC